MEVYLVRHGATQSNLDGGAYSGWVDVPLVDLGVEEARSTADRLRSVPASRVVCSDARRAVRTAQILAEPHGLSPEISPAWRELDYGDWDGLTGEQVEQRWPGAIRRLSEEPGFRVPGGETLSELLARLLPALEALVPAEQGKSDGDAIVVSHKGAIRVLLSHLLGFPIHHYKRIEQENCAINRLRLRDGRFVVAATNLTDHLVA